MTADYWKTHKCCGNGWKVKLVDPLLDLTEAIDPTIDIGDIKEKFGTLRIYHTGPEWFATVVAIFQIASESCCEDCGRWNGHSMTNDGSWGKSAVTIGVLPSGSWIKTLCRLCRDKRQAEWDKEFAEQKEQKTCGDVV